MATTLSALSPVVRAAPVLRARAPAARRAAAFRSVVVRAEGEKSEPDLLSNVVREYREDTGEVAASAEAKAAEAKAKKGGVGYVDEMEEIKRYEMSDAQKAKLRAEYYSLGGAPNKTMGANYFLWIVVVISALAVASALTGAI